MKLDGKSNAELTAMNASMCDDPANRMPSGSIWLYTPATRKKLDAISRAIAHNLRTARMERGDFINNAGYSGRQTNRR